MEVTMFPMGFGESILLHQGDSCLLVDCGSESKNKKMHFQNVDAKLSGYKKKSLLISHFHNDHTNGIKFLSEENLRSFEHVYLPHIFADDDRTIELLIAEYLLEARLDRRRKSPQIWGCLIPVVKEKRSIVLLQSGKPFKAASCDFLTLWPPEVNMDSQKSWDEFVDRYNYLQLPTDDINSLAQRTRRAIQPFIERIDFADRLRFFENIETELQDTLDHFENVRETYISTIWGNDNIAGITKRTIMEAYQSIKNKNETSIVFRTADDSQQQVLMTGDITPKILKEIVKADTPHKKHYHIIKAPHHGTPSSYFDFARHYSFDKLYISNGETTWADKSRGKISNKYLSDTNAYGIVCHNTQCRRCEFVYSTGSHAVCCKNCRANDP